MNVDYRTKITQSPLVICSNPSELWDLHMYEQVLNQNNQHCFQSLFYNCVLSFGGGKYNRRSEKYYMFAYCLI